MEHVNTQNHRQQQHPTQQQQFQQHQLEQQQQHNENQQQFCLRWHNHQTSLLSTLPVLLDQSHLTDVTISAEGRTLRAHRVVLSACSTFFMELFRALEASMQPVIIIPGATFGAIVALLTFMYSGEVNVYEEQIPMLLNLAETLGIKGLADVQHNKPSNISKQQQQTDFLENLSKESPIAEFERPTTPPTPTPPPATLLMANLATAPTLNDPAALPITTTTTPTLQNLNNSLAASPLLTQKLSGCTPLENFFLKSLQFYPNLLPQPLNFSQSALSKTTELLAKYQQQCNFYQNAINLPQCKELPDGLDYEQKTLTNDEAFSAAAKRLCTREKTPTTAPMTTMLNPNGAQHQQKDIKRLDKIVEHLRGSTGEHKRAASPHYSVANSSSTTTPTPTIAIPTSAAQYAAGQMSLKSSPTPNYMASSSPHYTKSTTNHAGTSPTITQSPQPTPTSPYITHEDHVKLQQHMEQFAAANCNREPLANAAGGTMVSAKSEPNLLALSEKLPAPSAPTKPPSNSKLYATCFICHKQLSNQYNLRVHLETHQNVRYACNVCSHVSRSKDALRKHVSYRHPGAPSPCESEARRKRVSKLSLNVAASSTTASSVDNSATTAHSSPTAVAPTAVLSNFPTNETPLTQLSSNPYLFLPNQFHFAAAAATAVEATTPMSSAANALDFGSSSNAHTTTQPPLNTTTEQNGDGGAKKHTKNATP